MQQLEISPKLTLDIPSGAKFTVKKAGRTEGYDGHSLRAYSYFSEQMPDINPNSVESINSIEVKYPALRQESKNPTFACTYGGTYRTMMANLGWSEEKSRGVENNYKELYKVSVEWVNNKLTEASKNGYVEVAFGLRLRTPLLKQVVWGTSSVPREALAEGRTAGNALGQSYGLLNNRAAVEFFKRVREAGYQHKIKPVSLIHDAIYVLIYEDVDLVHWVNENLIECMQWQELPEIMHDTVKLGSELSLFYPTWQQEIKLPNYASPEEIIKICKER